MERPLWACPRCGRTFAARRQVHTCAALGSIDHHFARSCPHVRATYDRIVEVARGCGPVDELAEATRIALHVRMSFAALVPRRAWLTGHLVLAERVASDRFTRVETFSPHNVLHAFRLDSPAEVDDEFAGWVRAAYAVGAGRHRS